MISSDHEGAQTLLNGPENARCAGFFVHATGSPAREWCPGRDLNPHSACAKKDFKSFASADFATRALVLRASLCRIAHEKHDSKRLSRSCLTGGQNHGQVRIRGCDRSAFEGCAKLPRLFFPLKFHTLEKKCTKMPYFSRFLLYNTSSLPYHRVDQRRAQNIL
jgi:hypothetical protein